VTGLPPAVTPDEVKECVKCSRPAVRARLVKKLTPEERATMREQGILRIIARGLCDTCFKHSKADGTLAEFSLNRKSAAQEFDIPAVWERIRSDGGHYRDLAEQVGLTTSAAQKLVQRLLLPEVPTLWERIRQQKQEFLEELEWLLQFNRGVYEIARKFGMTDQELIARVDDLRKRGLTDLNLNYSCAYSHQPLKEAA
jgi:hypothetical protein